MAHKFLLEKAARFRKDIDLRKEVIRHMGHCIMSFKDDGKLCSYLAESGYHRSSGARGVEREVRRVERKARKHYNNIRGLVTEEMNKGPFEKLEVRLMIRGDGRQDIGVIQKQEG
jgi:hypothetical protein